jgi:uncharacterized delta-60 repeat protein
VRSRRIVTTLVAAFIGIAALPASAAPGDVDTSFGVDGLASDGYGCGGSCTQPNDVATLADGRLVAVGAVSHESLPYFGVHAYTTVFGPRGAVLGPAFWTARGDLNALRAIAPTADGGAFTAGWGRRCLDALPLEECTLSRSFFMVVKHTPAGEANLTFDDDGVVLTPMGTGDAVATGIAPTSGGGVIAVGTATDLQGRPVTAIARYLADGRLDPSFGNRGRVLVRGVNGADVAVTSTGKVVVLGDAAGKLVVLRFLAGGTPDPAFGTNGRVDVAFAERNATAADVTLSGAKVVAGGAVETSSGATGFGVVRLTASGAPDLRFNGDGIVVTAFAEGNAGLDELAIGADGTVIAAGGNGVVRYTPRGARDRTFGADGRVWIAWPARGLALDGNGGAIVAVIADGLALTRVEL